MFVLNQSKFGFVHNTVSQYTLDQLLPSPYPPSIIVLTPSHSLPPFICHPLLRLQCPQPPRMIGRPIPTSTTCDQLWARSPGSPRPGRPSYQPQHRWTARPRAGNFIPPTSSSAQAGRRELDFPGLWALPGSSTSIIAFCQELIVSGKLPFCHSPRIFPSSKPLPIFLAFSIYPPLLYPPPLPSPLLLPARPPPFFPYLYPPSPPLPAPSPKTNPTVLRSAVPSSLPAKGVTQSMNRSMSHKRGRVIIDEQSLPILRGRGRRGGGESFPPWSNI